MLNDIICKQIMQCNGLLDRWLHGGLIFSRFKTCYMIEIASVFPDSGIEYKVAKSIDKRELFFYHLFLFIEAQASPINLVTVDVSKFYYTCVFY